MSTNRELLLKVLRSSRGKALTLDELLVRSGTDVGAKQQVRKELRALAREGLVEAEGRRFRATAVGPSPQAVLEAPVATPSVPNPAPFLPPPPKPGSTEVIGTLTRRTEGYGFIAPLHGGEDLFVPPPVMGDALDGDVVEALPGRGRDGRPVARSMRVLERRRQYAVGTYRAGRGRSWVEPRDQALGSSIQVKPSTLASDGDVVRVRLEEFVGGEVTGSVVSRLGLPGDPNVEVLSVAYAEGFADIFPPDALRAAQDTPDHVRPEDRQGRRDLTGIDLVTVDGEDARDFDDAIFVERSPGGYRLVVAIADVTHYVTSGSALDREAMRRATSVYFPHHVLPMLPERLSNGICSLNPQVERLCMVADIALDSAGLPLDTEVYPAVMKSRARCTYTEVAALIEGQDVPKLAPVSDMLKLSAELASRMTRARMKRGAIDFDVPEGHIVLAPDGTVTAIERRPRNAAHRLIEEFMLAANEAVARYFESRALPTVYRVHGEPKEEKLEHFVQLAAAFGYTIDVDHAGRVSAAELNEFLHRVEGKPEQRALNHLLLRSMMQAAYSSENIGHFGLAAPSYLHFTSPIRRYPDLIVHRLLKEHWARGGKILPEPVREQQSEELGTLAAHCSERERASTDAEREIDAFYAASFMVDKVGRRYPGTIASVAEFGLFVEILDPYVEGLVRAETLSLRWKLDEEKHRLLIGDGNKSYGVGEAVEIEVESANPLTRRVEFRLIENGAVVSVAGRPSSAGRPRNEWFSEAPVAPERKRAFAGRGGKPSKAFGGKAGGRPARGGGGGKPGRKSGGTGRGSASGKAAGQGGRGGKPGKHGGGKPGGGPPKSGGRPPRRGR